MWKKNFGRKFRRKKFPLPCEAGSILNPQVVAAGTVGLLGAYAYTQQETYSYPPNGLSRAVKPLPYFARCGLGDTEYHCSAKKATYSVNSQYLPNLDEHKNYAAQVLKENPDLFERLKRLRSDFSTPSRLEYAPRGT